MKKTLICLIVTFLLSCSLFSQQSINYNISFSPYTITDTLYKDSLTYNKVTINDCDLLSEVGKPVLPVKYVRLLIPRGKRATNVTINLTSNNQTQTLLHKICYATPPIPLGDSIENVEEGFDTILYSQSTPFPTSRASIVSQNFFRGNCIITIAVYPILYTPAINQISYVSNISFSLNYVSDSNYLKDMYFDEKDRGLLSHMIDNPDIVTQFAPVNLTPASSGTKNISVNAKYLVVTERKLLPAFAELLDWKRRKGLPSQAVAIEDILADPDYPGDLISNIYDDAGKLRQFLFDAYQQGVEYVLLAGANIPIRYGCYNPYPSDWDYIPTDLYFSDFNGDWNVDNDHYYGEPYYESEEYTSGDKIEVCPEIYIGRIMPQNEWEVKNWTRKLIVYEQNPGNGDGSYLIKGFFTQADNQQEYSDFQNEWSYHLNWLSFINLFEEEHGAEEAYNTPYIPNFPKGADVINELNSHYGLVGFLTHGAPNRMCVASQGNGEGDCYVPNSRYYITSFDNVNPNCEVHENGNGLDNLTNYCYPTILYSTSCTTIPFDIDPYYEGINRAIGDVYTCAIKGGGHAYLGNTRDGIYYSDVLAGTFFSMANIENIFNIGKMMALAKFMYHKYYTSFSLNLMGCPETELWSEIPEHFTNVITQENVNSLLVNAGIDDVSICVMSALDNGESYYQNVENVSSFNFQNISKPYNVTITKHNYFPYLYNPNDLYIQNINWNNERVISANRFFIGSNVTNTIPFGNVIINAPANILLKPVEDVIIQSNFEVVSGASFEIKINNSDEYTCL